MNETVIRINRYSRWALAAVFIYHGLVPKILFPSDVETSLVLAHGITESAHVLSYCFGVLEILLGLAVVWLSRRVWPIYLAIGVLVALLFDVVLFAPLYLFEAFNPVTLNGLAIVIAYFILLTQRPVPTFAYQDV